MPGNYVQNRTERRLILTDVCMPNHTTIPHKNNLLHTLIYRATKLSDTSSFKQKKSHSFKMLEKNGITSDYIVFKNKKIKPEIETEQKSTSLKKR